jgi:choline dehydrogenase-like flavoprotein
VQSFGRLPPPEILLFALHEDLRHSKFRFASPIMPIVAPVMRHVLKRMVEGNLGIATIVEDLPYPDNRIMASASPGQPSLSPVSFVYRRRPDDDKRIRTMRQLMRSALKSRAWRLIAQAENNQRLAHACGTCRYGDDPSTSVLDRDNRVHDLSNLYVVDASFFPSSGGTNPSLTIAANALRVAERAVERM